MDASGRPPAKAPLPEGGAGSPRLHAMSTPGLGGPPAGTGDVLARAPAPATAAGLCISKISAVLKGARRRDIPAKAATIQTVLRAEHLGQPAVVTAAYAASVRALVALLVTLNEQVKALQ